MKKNNILWMLGLTAVLASCDVNNDLDEIVAPSVPEVTLTTADLDFSNYIAVGASFTSGYTDGALFKAAQENSFPNILATKFSMSNGGDFNQPLMEDNIGGLVSGSDIVNESRLYLNGTGPTRLGETPTTQVGVPATNATSFHNYGIPGAKSFHLVASGYGDAAGLLVSPATANPYYVRMSPTQDNLIAEVMSKEPTFFTLSEIGGNDVLDYATNGGANNTTITPTATFDQVFTAMVNDLTAQGAKGVLADIPYITDLPFFTTVPYNAVPMDAATATATNTGFAAYNAGAEQALAGLVAAGAITQDMANADLAKRTITFVEGQNAVVIEDAGLIDLTGLNPALVSMRQATSEDLVVLTASSFIGSLVNDDEALVNGVSVPLGSQWVLTADEIQEIKTATDGYNATIKSVAEAKGLAFVDFSQVLETAASTGIQFDDYTLTTALVTGGLVSLDGIHLTSRGYALMANKILEAVDTTYSSNFALATNGLAKADDYPTNYSPTLD